MDCQVAQEEPEGRPGGPGDPRTCRWGRPSLFYLSLVLLAFLFLGSLAMHRAVLILKPATRPQGSSAAEAPVRSFWALQVAKLY